MTSSVYIQMSAFFIFSLAAIYVFVRFVPTSRRLIEQLGQHLLKKAFPYTSENEHYKFSILRIMFGLVLLYRAVNIQLLLLPEEQISLAGLFNVADIIASIMLTLGLFTQVALTFFIFIMWHIGESVLGSSTLANDVAAPLSLLLMLTGAGKYLSLDALMIRRWKQSHVFLFYTNTPPDNITIALAKFVALFSYWLVCVYSLAMHLNEPAWTTGVAGPLLLSNNFMSQWHAGFESLFIANNLATSIAKASIWIMMLWYVAILPLTLLGGLWRKYVIVWGVMFFSLSLVVLNLGSLAEIEFLLWAAIFWPKFGVDSQSKLLLFYDDKCNMCDKTVQIVTRLDVFNRIRLMPVSQSTEQLQRYNIDKEDALNDLYGVNESSGQARSGYELYYWLAKRTVLLWPALPILWAGFFLGIGPRIYRIIAKRRRELFGVCTLARPKASHHIEVENNTRPSFVVIAVAIHTLLLGTLYFLSIPAPYLGKSGSSSPATDAAKFYGIAPIDVFNRTDLRMSENWFTLTNTDSNTILPIFNEKGERLPYHKSDRIYFGYTLRFRRGEINQDDCAFERQYKTIEYLTRAWLSHSITNTKTGTFIYTQYHQSVPNNDSLIENSYKTNKSVIRCTQIYEVSAH